MRLSLTGKLSIGFAVVAILTSLGGGYLAFTLGGLTAQYSAVLNLSAANTDAANINYGIAAQQSAGRGRNLYNDPALEETFNTYSQQTAESIDSLISRLEGTSLVTDSDKAKVEELKQLNADYGEVVNEIFGLLAVGKKAESTTLGSQKASPTVIRMEELAIDIGTTLNTATQNQVTAIEEQVTRTQAIGSAALVLSLAVAMVIGLTLARTIARPVRQVAQSAQRLGNGDLTVEALTIKSRDEVGEMARAFNLMAGNLRALLQGVSANAQSVSASSQQLSASAGQAAQAAQDAAQAVGQVAGGAGEQSKSAEDVRQTMTELQQTIQQVATGAGQSAAEVNKASDMLSRMVRALESMAQDAAGVAEGSTQAAETARVGSEVVDRTLDGMERIRQAVGVSSARIKDLEQLSAQIGDITTAISDIADQTNLLALNAAIEAARAGEHGRGFAVVAEEVRKLAERASTSTQQINSLIVSIQAQTAEAVKAMEAGTAEADSGSRLASEAGRSLADILRTVEAAATDVRGVAKSAAEVQRDAQKVVTAFDALAAVTEESTAATEEMAAGSSQVNDAVTRIAELSQTNAAAAEEVSASVEELTASSEEVAASVQNLGQIAQALQEQVAKFKV